MEEEVKDFKKIMDEMGQMPLIFSMGGSKFRWEILKMAFANQQSYPPKSINTLLEDAEMLIKWVNEQHSIKIKNPDP